MTKKLKFNTKITIYCKIISLVQSLVPSSIISKSSKQHKCPYSKYNPNKKEDNKDY